MAEPGPSRHYHSKAKSADVSSLAADGDLIYSPSSSSLLPSSFSINIEEEDDEDEEAYQEEAYEMSTRRPGASDRDHLLGTGQSTTGPRAVQMPVRQRNRDGSGSSTGNAGYAALQEPYSSSDEDEMYSEKFSVGAHKSRRKPGLRPKRKTPGFFNKMFHTPAYNNYGDRRMQGMTSLRSIFVTISVCIFLLFGIWMWFFGLQPARSAFTYGWRSEWWGPSRKC